MDRLFCEHKLRKTKLLDGVWKFKTVDTAGVLKEIPEDAIDMYVPSCWNLRLGYLTYHGLAWYFKEFECESENIILSFGAVSQQAEVYLDGEHLGGHYGGYTEFRFDVSLKKGKHLLAVLTDSRADDETIPKDIADWYRYGGIYRSVELSEINDVFISRHKISYELDDDTAEVTVETEVKSFSGKKPEKLTVKLDNKTVYSGDYSEKISFTAEKIKRWDVFKPNLYFVEITVDDDDIIDRIGFREIKAEKGQFLINGKAITIKGVNHHEDWPDFGHAVPKQLMERDIDIIKDLGCNFIRGSHYPNSRAFVDYLDQNGILFWSEVPLWGAKAETLSSEKIIKRGVNMHREMVEQYYNHPSIVLWGLHNEIDTRCEDARSLTKKFADTIRAYDKSRPLTYATDRVLTDICLDLADVISINKYIGWYGMDPKEWYGFMGDVEKKLKSAGVSDKPVVMGEFGAAAIYGYHTFDNIKWTEEYQANLLTMELELFKKTPFICGSFVWQFSDGRTSAQGIDRARGFNNKGLVNEYRKPKLAYNAVKKIYTGE